MKASEIAELVGGTLHGDGEIEITSVSEISAAHGRQLAFFDKTEIPDNNAGCVIVTPAAAEGRKAGQTLLVVEKPKLAFARIASILHPSKTRQSEIHSSSIVDSSAQIGADVFIGAFVCVGDGSSVGARTQIRAGAKLGDGVAVGNDCVIHSNVFIEDGCTIGDGVILHAGVVIGADGFGYVKDEAGKYIKFPQIGTVVIGDNAEIGANTCIDRGALGETRIGEGTKIDNLVQVGHNVQIGKRCVIAAQTGISGSVVIEDDCVIGGQVGFGDHVRVQSGTVVGSQAGVLPGKIVRRGVWWGTPIQPLDDFKRQNALLKGIGRIKDDVRKLKDALKNKEARD